MALLVPGVFSGLRQPASLVIFQSSAAQTTLPVLKTLIGKAQSQVILVHLLYPPSVLHCANNARVQVLDFTDDVPGYNDGSKSLKDALLAAISSVDAAESVTVVVDSVDTLRLNLGSKAAAYSLLGAVYRAIQEHRTFQHLRRRISKLTVSSCPQLRLDSSSTTLLPPKSFLCCPRRAFHHPSRI